MVAQKLKILSKRTVRGSALVTISDTKQDFTVLKGKQRCTENGLCNICIFLYVFIVFLFTTNLIPSTRHDFFYSIFFEKLSLRTKTDQEDNFNLGKIVFHDNSQQRKS